MTLQKEGNRTLSEKGMKSSYIRGGQTIRKDYFMPTTNITDYFGCRRLVRFFRIEQR
ncbi:protein of unknown function [Mesotoga infera]|uniref:Uncharacterized protein n=1 Tax=Mesotoga infera TaxID=1236046 RepID=A0A7Z7LFW1_9BACT|nr:protein of unknown function [Mesotoga infera]